MANGSQDAQNLKINSNHEENQNKVNLAKNGVRNRRGRRMQVKIWIIVAQYDLVICFMNQISLLNRFLLWFQTCQAAIKPLTPSTLLDSICWSISEPSSSASIYTDSFSLDDAKTSTFVDANEHGKESDASFVNFSRPLSER